MALFWQGIVRAFDLVFSFDTEVWTVTWLSLQISGCSTLVSLVLGMPLGIALARSRFPGRSIVAVLSDLETAPIDEQLRATLRLLGKLTRQHVVNADDMRAATVDHGGLGT